MLSSRTDEIVDADTGDVVAHDVVVIAAVEVKGLDLFDKTPGQRRLQVSAAKGSSRGGSPRLSPEPIGMPKRSVAIDHFQQLLSGLGSVRSPSPPQGAL